jgi:hypothetical protein
LFYRLGRDRFTGVVYTEHGDAGAVFSFRNGKVVFAENLGDAPSIADTLLEKQLLTKAQYAEIATQVLESLAENEEVAFCEQAVRMGVLTRQQVEAEMARAVRGAVIQAVGWDDCRIEVDSDPDALTGILELPQDVGPLVHIGVRTFFDEDRIRATIRRQGDVYARLLRAEGELEGLLGLDEGERALVAKLRPDQPLSRAIDDSGLDSLEAWQVICTLVLSAAVELGSAPFSAAERSGVRTAQPATPSGKYSSPAEVREERVRPPSQARMPSARELPQRPPSSGKLVAAREEDGRAGSQARINVGRGPDGRALSQPRFPAAREEDARHSSGANPRPQPAQPAPRPNTPASTRSSSASHPAIQPPRRNESVVAQNPATANATPPRAAQPPSASPSLPSAPSDPTPRDRARPRKLSSALKRLDRDLKQLRVPTGNSVVEPLPTGPGQGQAYARARVEQLRQMRAAAPAAPASAVAKPAGPPTKGPNIFRAAQDAMRDQQFGRAHELMRKACEAEPDNQVYSMYGMWAAFRANALRQEEIAKLRLLLRERVSDDQYKAFAYYALGHISLAEKKDDQAEKFFMKAVELDKNNKDAERHLRIIAVRRKAVEADKNNKIFGIEIGPKKSS